MATIDELMIGKAPGEIKVRHNTWYAEYWFCPYFRLIDGSEWVGLDNAGGVAFYHGYDFELWTEPKPKVKRWLWRNVNHPYMAIRCMSEAEIRKHFGSNESRWQKIPGTEAEMEE